MARERIALPPESKRGQNISHTKRGWRIVNPNQTLTYKAIRVAGFNGDDGEPYLVFKIVMK